jgi:hypothetical protein
MNMQSLARQSCRVAVVTAVTEDFLMLEANGSKLVNSTEVSRVETELNMCSKCAPKLYYTQYIVTDSTKPLPGNSSVNMFKLATIEECPRC